MALAVASLLAIAIVLALVRTSLNAPAALTALRAPKSALRMLVGARQRPRVAGPTAKEAAADDRI